MALAACATPQRDVAADRGPAISMATLTTITQTLSSDGYEGRAPTTAGEDKTIALIADRFRKAGLEPGNKGSWYQEVPLVETIATPTALEISDRISSTANTSRAKRPLERERRNAVGR